MDDNLTVIQVRFTGLRPMMFDRYAGDNKTQLPTAEKMYLTPDRQLIMPAINVLSLLASRNNVSVSNMFFGKQGRQIATGISAYCAFEPFEIPILDDDGEIFFSGWNQQIQEVHHVARIKGAGGGIPNPKSRPLLSLPWHMDFVIGYQENNMCPLASLRQALALGGTLGLGTFRPVYGRYELSRFEY